MNTFPDSVGPKPVQIIFYISIFYKFQILFFIYSANYLYISTIFNIFNFTRHCRADNVHFHNNRVLCLLSCYQSANMKQSRPRTIQSQISEN